MYISSWPGLTPRDFLGRQVAGELPYPLNAAHRLSFCVARSGIYHLFRALNLKPGDVVLAPDYHSGNEDAAMRAAGATVVYYPILRNLEPDMDAFRRLLTPKVKVIYAIHYLGWPQPVSEMLAAARGINAILIEDCALSLLSEHGGKPLGASGDYSIFCLYKTLPVPNGGLLVQNRQPLDGLSTLALRNCPQATTVGRTAELALEALRTRTDRLGQMLFGLKRSVGRLLRGADVKPVPIGNIGWDVGDVDIAMSSICNTVMRRLDYDRIRARRRENFLLVRDKLRGRVKMLREDLNEGVCPLFFPILVKDKPAAARALWGKGIAAVEFWNDPRPRSERTGTSDAQYLRDHVLELPIHQDVSHSHLEYMANQVLSLNFAHAG